MARNVKNKQKTKPKRKAKSAMAEELAPTMQVCPKSVLVRLLNRCNKATEEAATARGIIGQEIGEATARHNLHPWAFKITRKLANMSELKRAEAVFQLDAYVDALDLASQPDMLPDRPARTELPTSGPGTPTDPAVMEQVGRGPQELIN